MKTIYPNCSGFIVGPAGAWTVIRCEGRTTDTQVDVWLQVRCPAFDHPPSHGFSSISGERRPDIVVTVSSPAGRSFIVIDAKYRVGREWVLEGTESAHMYRDCLRWEGRKTDLSVLLVTRGGGAPLLETMKYRKNMVLALRC